MNDRAVSVTVGYAINLTVATLLLSGLFIAAGGLVESERERAVEAELDVVGGKIAAELQAADRMVAAGTEPTVEVRVDLPRRIAGSDYTVTVEDDQLELRTAEPDSEVTLLTRTTVAVESGTVSGGTLDIEWRSGSERLVVNRA